MDRGRRVFGEVEPQVFISIVGLAVVDADGFVGEVVPLFGACASALWPVLFVFCLGEEYYKRFRKEC